MDKLCDCWGKIINTMRRIYTVKTIKKKVKKNIRDGDIWTVICYTTIVILQKFPDVIIINIYGTKFKSVDRKKAPYDVKNF